MSPEKWAEKEEKIDQGYDADICRGTGRETGTKMKKIKQKHQKPTAKGEVILW